MRRERDRERGRRSTGGLANGEESGRTGAIMGVGSTFATIAGTSARAIGVELAATVIAPLSWSWPHAWGAWLIRRPEELEW
jgi:hypothetical protein